MDEANGGRKREWGAVYRRYPCRHEPPKCDNNALRIPGSDDSSSVPVIVTRWIVLTRSQFVRVERGGVVKRFSTLLVPESEPRNNATKDR